ncbi:acyltransferase family protein [Vibrio breoganii]|uniref:acyltransferase family protein n=1 Tax=Vibrio breoganii TaxID=553239 RepID=UPI000C81A663|nr:acyltransferase family protein [Vibrio breoganii]PMK33054.1 hypothetical protein BCU03_04675 [Vibrio breoganii]
MLSYRKELDGLRALAVIAVIIYHANLEVFGVKVLPGGFLGVDVFFVLSGYLITGIIRGGMDQGSFSFVDFYWRRAKRIIPALLLVLIVSSIVAYLFLLPDDLVNYAQSLQSTLFFGSNYHFYNEDSYIADASIYKPLLHTWSLAVEWQFYILYPIIVWLIHRFVRQYMLSFLILLGGLSLAYSIVIVRYNPDMAFYLLPSRAWELVFGGITTFYNREKLLKPSIGKLEEYSYQLLPLLGLFLVVSSLMFIDHSLAHPSYVTLIPVIGVCLFVTYSHKGELTNRILSTKYLVYIGLISYSLYLWHNPVFVFFRFIKREAFRHEQLILLVSVSIVLAVVTYRFIENSFRRKQTSKRSLLALIISMICLFIFSYQTSFHKGFPERIDSSIMEAYEMYKQPEFRRLEDLERLGSSYLGKIDEVQKCIYRTVDTSCKFGNGDWITIGDSFVGQYDYVLNQITQENGDGMQSLSYEQCPFVSPSIWFGDVPECTIVNEERLEFIANLSVKKKFIVASDYSQFNEPKKGVDSPITDGKRNLFGGNVIDTDIAWISYVNNIQFLLENGHEVYVIYSVPRPDINVKKEVLQQIKYQVSSYKRTWSSDRESYARADYLSEKLEGALPQHPNLHKIYPTDIFCENKRCEVISKDGGLYNIGGHLSSLGASRVLEEIFDE